MRVLIGMPDPASRGGPSACEPPFVAALRGLGVDVVETTYIYGDALEETAFTTRVRRVVRTAWRVRRILRGERFDLLHLNTSFDTKTVLRDAFTLALLTRSKTPVFLKIHGSDDKLLTSGRRPIRVLARYVLGRADAIGVLSSAQRDHFLGAGVPEEKLLAVRNALPPRPPLPDSEAEFRSEHELPARLPLLLFISRLVTTKGVLDAVRACGLLRDRGRTFVLCCVGDGPARAEAEDTARRLGLEGSVRFFGYVPEAEAAVFYRHCDVLVFPTFYNEGLPVVLLNALAAGLPIVTTRTRGAIDYLVEGETCLWVEPQRPEQVADRVEMLLGSDEMRTEMADRARRTARAFEPETVARDYLDVYEGLIAAEQLPGRARPGGGIDAEAESS
jgi:glycosyltransferase involved in cell wall biosynthesis